MPCKLHFPYLTAEMGGGMAASYHRRPLLSVDDTAAMAVVKLGSGVVLYGITCFTGEQSGREESDFTGVASHGLSQRFAGEELRLPGGRWENSDR